VYIIPHACSVLHAYSVLYAYYPVFRAAQSSAKLSAHLGPVGDGGGGVRLGATWGPKSTTVIRSKAPLPRI